MTVMYGIKNCDTIKKAKNWLDEHNVSYDFYDYKKTPPTKEMITSWVSKHGLETILNKKGTTWRKLPDDVKENIDQSKAIELMAKNPSMIKRPVIECDDKILVGFNESLYEKLF